MSGIYEQIKDSQTYTIQSGLLGNLSLKRALNSLVGTELPEQEEQLYQKLLTDAEFRRQKENERFLAKWGEEAVKLHTWLNEKFDKHSLDAFYDAKTWRISDFLDNCEQSESIYLKWDRGNYKLIFTPEDGYGKDVVIKDNISNEYIYQCIENWA